MSVLSLQSVTFSWPDGTRVFTDISGTFGNFKTGIIGRNGAGKSTLFRLITGELRPESGTISPPASVAYLPQNINLRSSARVVDLLGVAPAFDAVRAIAGGAVDPENFDTVGDSWDIETQCESALAKAGLDPEIVERKVSELSGGEVMSVALAGVSLSGAQLTILDEPTNNLDRVGRQRIYDAVAAWKGSLLVASHDVELLDLMDHTCEIYAAGLDMYPGPFSEWKAWREAKDEAALQEEAEARKVLAKEKRQRIETETKLARSARKGRTDFENKKAPKIVMGLRASSAEVSAGRLRGRMQAGEEAARERLREAGRLVRSDREVHIDVPDPRIGNSKQIAAVRSGGSEWIIQGPERVAIVGPNGGGKTTLLRTLLGEPVHCEDFAGSRLFTDRVAYLPQRIGVGREDFSARELLQNRALNLSDQEISDRLGRFMIRGDMMNQAAGSLSGGERFRVELACLLLADPTPELLIVDEPTNNVDIPTVEHLVEALRAYRGAVIAVSHDAEFLRAFSPDLTLEVDRGHVRVAPGN